MAKKATIVKKGVGISKNSSRDGKKSPKPKIASSAAAVRKLPRRANASRAAAENPAKRKGAATHVAVKKTHVPSKKTAAKAAAPERTTLPVNVFADAIRKSEAMLGAGTHNEFLIRKLLECGECSGERGLLVQDLVYNLSDDMRNLAGKSGFNLGVEVYENSDHTMNSLERVLQNAGLGKMIYHPFESSGIITSYGTKSGARTNLGARMHTFESGLISGYLTAHTSKRIFVRETRCVYDGDRFCQFAISSDESAIPAKEARLADLDMVVREMGQNIDLCKKGVSEPYYLLSAEPLLQEPVFSEVSKFSYFLGKKLAGINRASNFNKTLLNVARYLGVYKTEIAGRKNPSIDLAYDSVSSVGNFVDLSTAMLAGFAKGALNKNINIQRVLTSRKNYLVKMQVLPAAAATLE